MSSCTYQPEKSWAEIEALKIRLNRETSAKRQSTLGTSEDRCICTLFGGRLTTFVDAQGRPIT